jgi:hypothetical protein
MLHVSADRLSTPVFQGASLWGQIDAVARAASRSLLEWRRRICERNEMMTLGELEPRVILRNRSDVRLEASKWFSRA